jgi:hypothetical protein
MTHRTVFTLASILILAAGPAAATSPVPTPRMDIVVDGRVLPRYAAYNASYVEALKDKDYEIRLYNPLPVRVAVALSVDGLNTIDARHTAASVARKWVIGPYETVTISGWQVNMNEARRFHFTSEPKSYAQWLGKTENVGVVSAVFYRERVAPVMVAPEPRDQVWPGASSESASTEMRSKQALAGAPASAAAAKADEYAATGIGRNTHHAVTEVSLDLETTPVASVDVRYEYRSQLVKLGILPPPTADDDPLARRQKARGFAQGFCPDPRRDQ